MKYQILITVWLCGELVFEALHFQIGTEPIRLFIYIFTNRQSKLAVLQRRTAVGLPSKLRIIYSFF